MKITNYKLQITNKYKYSNSKHLEFGAWNLGVVWNLVLGIWILIVILGNPNKINAQSIALSIFPPLLEVMIKPGKSATQVYKLTNSGEPTVITLKLYELTEFGIKEDPQFIPDKWITLISNDIVFDKPFLLGTDKTAEFLVKVNPPTGTPEQDFYRALVFTTTPPPFTDTTESVFSQNLVSPLLVSVTSTGVLTQAAQIAKFQLAKISDSFDGLTADIEIKNSGKNYFRPVGKLTLVGPVGRGSYDLVPNVIFAGQTRKLLTEHTPPSKEELKTLYLPGFYIGKYQLTLDFTLDETNQKVTETKTFYAVPWKAGSLILILIIIVIMTSKRKRTS